MKFSLIFCLLVGSLRFLNAADPFVAPAYVKELDDLKLVKSQAARENKGITFLLMEPGST